MNRLSIGTRIILAAAVILIAIGTAGSMFVLAYAVRGVWP